MEHCVRYGNTLEDKTWSACAIMNGHVSFCATLVLISNQTQLRLFVSFPTGKARSQCLMWMRGACLSSFDPSHDLQAPLTNCSLFSSSECKRKRYLWYYSMLYRHNWASLQPVTVINVLDSSRVTKAEHETLDERIIIIITACLVLAPLNGVQVDALLDELPQRA